MFIKVPPEFLEKIYVGCERIPSLYFHANRMARNFFWERLKISHDLILNNVKNRKKCLDFGCGNGVFLPSLASLFENVVGVDIETREANKLVNKYNLGNKVKIINIDINESDLLENEFNIIVALDVLEHFKNLNEPIKQINNCLEKNGFLLTSLPTENFFTWLIRKISRTQKPSDHYHYGKSVERLISKNGFEKINSMTLASYFPLYYITLWRKK